MKFAKISDTKLSLDIKGQGCWDDCYIGHHWLGEMYSTDPYCEWIPESWTAETWPLW